MDAVEPKQEEAIEADQVSRLLQQLYQNYLHADQFARKVSNFREEVAIPANNELRYAGYHLLLAVADHGNNSYTEEELRNALSHCRRAKFEAAEAGIISALNMIAIFQDDYRSVTIGDIVPNYHEICKCARECQALLEKHRKRDKDGAIVDNDFAELFNKLASHVSLLNDCRDEMNKKVRIDRIRVLRYWLGITATVVFGIFGVIGFFLVL